MSTTKPLRYGSRVRRRRVELDISRERLAAETELSVSTIARLELSDKLPGTEALIRIARALDTSLDELVADIDGEAAS